MSGTWMTTRAWLLMLPLLVIMLAVIGWPMVDTVRLSFTDAKLDRFASGSFRRRRQLPEDAVEQQFPARALRDDLVCGGLRHGGDGDRRSGRSPAEPAVLRPHRAARSADPALGLADRRQRDALAVHLQSRIWRTEFGADAGRPARQLSLLARRAGHRHDGADRRRLLEELSARRPHRARRPPGRAARHYRRLARRRRRPLQPLPLRHPALSRRSPDGGAGPAHHRGLQGLRS
jgi:predicted transcriptional regulator